MKKIISCFAIMIALTACNNTVPKEALSLSPESLRHRQMQTRKFETGQERNLLSAGAQVLQDMGFNIDESETSLGIIVASKKASAVNSGQIAAAVFVALIGGGVMATDSEQNIRASLVTRPTSSRNVNLRVTFQRVVTDNYGNVSRREFVNDESLYQDFFSKLSKSVFLEAHQI